MQAIPTADVIITNPTHYGGVKYTPGEMNAFKVAAKGQPNWRRGSRKKGKNIVLYSRECGTRPGFLYDSIEVGQGDSSGFLSAVAEVLAFVYRLRKKTV